MEEIIVKSEFPCLIINGNEQTFLEDSEYLTLDFEKNIYVYPVSKKNILPFKIDFSNESKFYKIFSYNEKLYCCLLSPKIFSRKTIENTKIAGKELRITLSESEIIFATKNEICSLALTEVPKEYQCEQMENFSVTILKYEKHQKLVLFNIENHSFKIYTGDHFEIKDKKFSFSHRYSDFSSSAEEFTVELSKNEIKETKKQVESNFEIPNEKTICFAFLDAVIQQNYSVAKTLLDNSHQDIEEKKLKEFLSTFLSYFCVSENTFALFYPNETKILHFNLSNGKIANFSFE